MPVVPRYPDDLSSIPRANQAVWLDRPATPLVLHEVFNRRKNLVTSDIHVLLVTADQTERVRMRADLEGLGYKATAASSGKIAQDMLTDRAGEFHVVMISVTLSSEHSSGEGPDCVGLLAWARDMPVLKEISMIVLGGYSIDASLTIELVRCGALDVLTKPVPMEALHRLRQLVGTTQSLQQQRYASRGEGGARLVTTYLLKKERQNPEAMGLPSNSLDRHDGHSAPQLGEVTISVLLMQRDTRRSNELPALLRECGFTVGAICRTKNDVMKALSLKNASWNLFLIEMGPETSPGIGADPKFAEFFSAVQAVLREMSMRQVILPAIAVQEDKSTDSVVRTMRLGVVDAVLPPFSKSKMRHLLRYVLKPADLRFLHEQSKRLHAQQQSGLGGIPGGGDKGGRQGSGSLSRQNSGSGGPEKRTHRSNSVMMTKQKMADGVPLTAAASAAVARMEAVKSVPVGRGKGGRSAKMLDEHNLAEQIEEAERTLSQAESASSSTLTQAASRRRAELQRTLDEERKVHSEQIDERLVASHEAIEAFQRAADAAKRNARRLTQVLEREQAIGVGGAGRELLEQRVGAANAAAAALQSRLSLLERAHERKQEALQKGATRRSKESVASSAGGEDSLHLDAASEMHASVLAPVSLLMVPSWSDRPWEANLSEPTPGLVSLAPSHSAPSLSTSMVPPLASGGESMPSIPTTHGNSRERQWQPVSLPPAGSAPSLGVGAPGLRRPDTAPDHAAGHARRLAAVGQQDNVMSRTTSHLLGGMEGENHSTIRQRSRQGTSASLVTGNGRGALVPSASDLAKINGAAGPRTHGPDCACIHCGRRRQLLLWRDTMLDAQRVMARTPQPLLSST